MSGIIGRARRGRRWTADQIEAGKKFFSRAVRPGVPFSPPKMTKRFSPLFWIRFKEFNFSGDFGILKKKSAVEISVISINDLPKYHFLHQTEYTNRICNPSFVHFNVLVSNILVRALTSKKIHGTIKGQPRLEFFRAGSGWFLHIYIYRNYTVLKFGQMVGIKTGNYGWWWVKGFKW